MQRCLVALGDANVDLITRLVPAVVAGSRVVKPATEMVAGGSVANAAVCLSRLGKPVRFIGKVGDDSFGRFVREDLEKEGVDARFLTVCRERPTVVILAFIDLSGERHISLWPPRDAAHTTLGPDDVTEEVFADAGWLHCSGLSLRQEPMRTATLKAMHMARDRHVTVSLDLNMRLEFFATESADIRAFHEAVELSDVILGSAREEVIPLARILQGGRTGDRTENEPCCHDEDVPSSTVIEACRTVGRERKIVVARTGRRGAIVFGPGIEIESPAFEVAVVDTTGSGDAFDAGFLAALMDGRDLRAAARWGNAAAALNLTGVGARNVNNMAALSDLLAAAAETEGAGA